jgi:hypothetical protein
MSDNVIKVLILIGLLAISTPLLCSFTAQTRMSGLDVDGAPSATGQPTR